MEFEKVVLNRLNKLIKEGWCPHIQYNFCDTWSCRMFHKTFDISAGIQELAHRAETHSRNLEDVSPLCFEVNKHKTIFDAIIAACDIAEVTQIAPTG